VITPVYNNYPPPMKLARIRNVSLVNIEKISKGLKSGLADLFQRI
jgi:hypothetical protein